MSAEVLNVVESSLMMFSPSDWSQIPNNCRVRTDWQLSWSCSAGNQQSDVIHLIWSQNNHHRTGSVRYAEASVKTSSLPYDTVGLIHSNSFGYKFFILIRFVESLSPTTHPLANPTSPIYLTVKDGSVYNHWSNDPSPTFGEHYIAIKYVALPSTCIISALPKSSA